jgi:hypothetical protein
MKMKIAVNVLKEINIEQWLTAKVNVESPTDCASPVVGAGCHLFIMLQQKLQKHKESSLSYGKSRSSDIVCLLRLYWASHLATIQILIK